MQCLKKIASLIMLVSIMVTLTLCPHGHCHEEEGAFAAPRSVGLDKLEAHSSHGVCGCLCHVQILVVDVFTPAVETPFCFSAALLSPVWHQYVAEKVDRPPLA
jgi:hypothetical protein